MTDKKVVRYTSMTIRTRHGEYYQFVCDSDGLIHMPAIRQGLEVDEAKGMARKLGWKVLEMPEAIA